MNDKKIRLNKAIALDGHFSRRKADELIKAGKVKVNNKIVFDLSCKVSSLDLIQVNDRALESKEHKYFLFYKPRGYITTRKDEFNRKTIYDLLPSSFRYLKPVGRLDRDTEGLLILTNDGDFINKVLHPSKNIKKTYMVEINESLSIDEANFVINKLLLGVRLDEKICKWGFWGVFVLRIVPLVPYRFLDIAAGLTGINYSQYILAVFLGSPVRIFWLQSILAVLGENVFKNPRRIIDYFNAHPTVLAFSLIYVVAGTILAIFIKRNFKIAK